MKILGEEALARESRSRWRWCRSTAHGVIEGDSKGESSNARQRAKSRSGHKRRDFVRTFDPARNRSRPARGLGDQPALLHARGGRRGRWACGVPDRLARQQQLRRRLRSRRRLRRDPRVERLPRLPRVPQGARAQLYPAVALGACALSDYANNKSGLCFPKMETLANTLKRSVRTIQRHLHLLKTLGHIEFVERRRHKGNCCCQLRRTPFSRTSENSVKAKFAELSFHDIG